MFRIVSESNKGDGKSNSSYNYHYQNNGSKIISSTTYTWTILFYEILNTSNQVTYKIDGNA